MATIKNYTDISQSRKLVDILPIESADMIWANDNDVIVVPYDMATRENVLHDFIPCWSLTALLDILPNEIITDNRFECHYQIHIRKYDGGDNTTLYQIAYGNDRGSSGSWHDMINTGEKESLIDCCVQMIIKLNELKML